MNVRQKLLKGRPLTGHVNVAPVVTITAFNTNPANGVPATGFAATATDSEQGDISNQIVWTTSQGTAGSPTTPLVLGTGASPTLTFPVAGSQTVTASVTDSYGSTGSDSAVTNVS